MSSDASDVTVGVPVLELLDSGKDYLQVELVAGAAGVEKRITHQRIQKPGLAMAGDVGFIHPGRVQVFGASEITYLKDLDPDQRRALLEPITACPLSCVAITKGLDAPPELAALCDAQDIPLLRSSLLSSAFIDRLNHFLDAHFAPRTTVHGVMVDILGVGVLITGPSGIGKSECALDLVMRGHRLVSDDIVEIRCRQGEVLVARGPEIVRHHMEVRGLGIINIAHLFGVASTRQRKRVELVIDLQPGDVKNDCERLGLDGETTELLDVEIPLVRFPVVPGRSVANLVEVAARNLLLRLTGLNPAADLDSRLRRAMEEPQYAVGAYGLDEGDLE